MATTGIRKHHFLSLRGHSFQKLVKSIFCLKFLNYKAGGRRFRPPLSSATIWSALISFFVCIWTAVVTGYNKNTNTKKYHVFAPMGRFQLESIYLYFPPSSQLLYLCFCPVGLCMWVYMNQQDWQEHSEK